MDPVLTFCIKHPEVDVSFVAYDWSGIRDQVKVEIITVSAKIPFRASRIIDTIDNVETELEAMYKELKEVIAAYEDMGKRKRKGKSA